MAVPFTSRPSQTSKTTVWDRTTLAHPRQHHLEISQALDCLLEELKSSEEAKVLRTTGQSKYRSYQQSHQQLRTTNPNRYPNRATSNIPSQRRRSCPLCKAAQRSHSHYFSPAAEASVRKGQVSQSPYLDVFYGHKRPRITLDTGATDALPLNGSV